MKETQEAGFWALVELFGHQQIAGHVSSETVGGQSFVRVDVPETSKQAGWSKLFGTGAIYAMTPMAEDLVRLKAEALQTAPLTAWDLPEEWRNKIRQPALPAPCGGRTGSEMEEEPEIPFDPCGDDDDGWDDPC